VDQQPTWNFLHRRMKKWRERLKKVLP
jgi:hypothetical protein